jgi:hypothetical protein
VVVVSGNKQTVSEKDIFSSSGLVVMHKGPPCRNIHVHP